MIKKRSVPHVVWPLFSCLLVVEIGVNWWDWWWEDG